MTEQPAAPSSPLAGLRDRLEAQQSKLFKDLPVPRWAERMGIDAVVRFKPIPLKLIQAQQKWASKSRDEDAALLANARILVEACLGVYYRDNNGELHSFNPDGDPPRFDPDLAAIIGADEVDGALGVVRKLYFSDGDIVATAEAVAAFSGYTNSDLIAAAQGE